MHDGQNLFDRETSSIGEWCADETMEKLSEEGLEAIIVGIPHMGESRIHELSPYACPRSGSRGLGRAYLSFITDTLKPLIDDSFRTCPEASMTGIIGSSMGGLVSLYALFRHPDVFGACGAMSPALWFDEFRIFEDVKSGRGAPCRIYLDTGTEEVDLSKAGSIVAAAYRARSRQVSDTGALISNSTLSGLWMEDVRRLRDVIARHGSADCQLLYVEEAADHSEASWAKRLPRALRFLLSTRAGT
jgi:predicted alpha/beta superfamily hydrolase